MKELKVSEQIAVLALLLFIEVWVAYVHCHWEYHYANLAWFLSFCITGISGAAFIYIHEIE